MNKSGQENPAVEIIKLIAILFILFLLMKALSGEGLLDPICKNPGPFLSWLC